MKTPQKTPDVPMSDRQALKDLPNVYGTGYGPRREDGRPVTDGPTHLVVFVESKVAADDLADSEMVPETVAGVPTDVQEAEMPKLQGDPSYKETSVHGALIRQDNACRPAVLGGIYLDAEDRSPLGTATSRMRNASGDPILLTNRHVCKNGLDDGVSPIGRPIGDGKTYNPDTDTFEFRRIGEVTEIEPADHTEGAENTSDSGIITLDTETIGSTGYLGYPNESPDSEISEDGWWPPLFHRPLIEISGRGGIISGQLIAVDVETYVSAEPTNLYYVDLVSYTPFIGSGSSGAPVGHTNPETGTFHPIANNFAGSVDRSIGAPYSSLKANHGVIAVDNAPRQERTFSDDEPTFFEVCPITYQQAGDTTVTVCVANIGVRGSKNVSIYAPDSTGTQLASTGVSLDPGDWRFIDMDIGELPPGDHILTVETPDIFESWVLQKRGTTATSWTDGNGVAETTADGVVKT